MLTPVTPHPVTQRAEGSERSGLARLWHQLGPGSRKRHARARIEAQRLTALRYQWQHACQHVGLGLTIYSPSGHSVAVPRIARADLGPPVSFTVQLRPGQRAADIAAAASRLAPALGVAGLQVTDRGAGWVIVLVVDPRGGCADGGGDAFRSGGPDTLPPRLEVRAA